MIFLFHGNDSAKVREKAFAWVAAARVKEPNLAYVRLTREELTPASLEEVSSSGGLFVSRLLVLIDDPFPVVRITNEEDRGDEEGVSNEYIDEYMAALAASDNAIVIVAPKLSMIKVKKFISKVKVEYKFDAPESKIIARGFNSSLVDALGIRSREKLWLEVNRALVLGDAPEMIHGLLHWKVRDLMQKGSRSWKSGEVRHVSLELIQLLQDSRRGGLELGLALEKFALSI